MAPDDRGSVSVGVLITPNQVARRVHDVAAGVGSSLESGLQRAVIIMEGELREEAMSGHPVRSGLFWQSPPGAVLGRRTGQAVSSLTSRVARSGMEVVGAVGSPLERVLLNEVGGTLRPKTGRALAIPTVNATDNRGSLRNLFASYASLRDVPGLFKLPRGKRETGDPLSGRAWLVMKSGRRIDRMFLLTATATTPPKGFFAAATTRIAGRVVETVGAAVTLSVERHGHA